MSRIDKFWLESQVTNSGSKAEGLLRLYKLVKAGLKEKKFTAENFSYRDLAKITGVWGEDGTNLKARMYREAIDLSDFDNLEEVFQETNVGLMTNAFQVLTQELLGSQVIEGYNNALGMITDQLVQTIPVSRVGTKIPGLTSFGLLQKVPEGHPYPHMGLTEKYVLANEAKYGGVISFTEELLMFDQTGLINDRASKIGEQARITRERQILRGILEADYSAGETPFRPMGVAEQLYNVDGSNKNYIGSGNTTDTDFASAVPLTDWKDVDQVLQYRATKIYDDRVDGDPMLIAGLNSGANILLVPEALRSTADYIVANSTGGETHTRSGAEVTNRANPVASYIGKVLSSPYIDEVDADNWYYGNFRKQFAWTEIWPVQTFSQGRDSESAFERDCILSLKVRYYGGICALDTPWVTKVDGA